MENAIRIALHSALKTLEFKTYDVERVDFLDVLLEDIMDVLFPKQPKVSIVTLPTVDEKTVVVEEKKKPAEKKTKKTKPAVEEEKPAVEEEKPVVEPVVEEEKPVVVEEKKKPGPKPKVDTDGNVIQRAKPGPKPKPKTEGPGNIDKLTPTQTKKLKAAAENSKVDFDKTAVLAYLNLLTKEEFDGKKLEEHAATYYAQLAEASAQKDDENTSKKASLTQVPFQGKTYGVDETTERVYEQEYDVDGKPTVASGVGYVGMAAFKDMRQIYEEIKNAPDEDS